VSHEELPHLAGLEGGTAIYSLRLSAKCGIGSLQQGEWPRPKRGITRMSDIPIDSRARLDIGELISRIERQQAETHKFVAEQHKLMAVQSKLKVEDSKLQRDRAYLPWTVVATFLGAGAPIFAAGAGFFKLIQG
jgi:hypothetical protein